MEVNHPRAPHVSRMGMSHPPLLSPELRGTRIQNKGKKPHGSHPATPGQCPPALLLASFGLLGSFPCLLSLPCPGQGWNHSSREESVAIFHTRALCLVEEMSLTWCWGSAAPYLLTRHSPRAHHCHQPRCAEPCAPGSSCWEPSQWIPCFFPGSRSRAGAEGAEVGADK